MPYSLPNIPPKPIVDKVEKTILKDGVLHVVFVDNSDSSVPNYSDYTLDKLLDAGVPLKQINPSVMVSQPTDEAIADILNPILDAGADNAGAEDNQPE